MYQLTSSPDVIVRIDDGATIPRGHRWWDDYEAWVAAGNTAEPQPNTAAAIARGKRDSLLMACDWTQALDSPLTADNKAQWAAYRAALRNVPEQAGFPGSITWPAIPTTTPSPSPAPSAG